MKRLGYQERNTLVHSYDYKAFYSENSYIAFGDTMGYIAGLDSIYTLTRGRKKYEASNHLGNVMVVFTDKRINQCINDSVRYYRADLRSAYDYYPFGMLIPDRTFDSTAYIQLPDRVDTTISQRIKIQIPSLNPGQNITLTKDGETYVLAQYQSGNTGAQYSATIAGSAIVNELSFVDSSGYLIIENTTLGGQKICYGIPLFSINIAGTNYVINCSQSIDTVKGGLLSEAGYLFGFNTQERDDEIYGKGNSYSAEYWQYDSRLGRRWNVDPIIKYWESPYGCFLNNPIYVIDIKGDNGTPVKDANGNSTGQIRARFVFINNGVEDENDVADYISYFMSNLNSNFNGSRTFINEAGTTVQIIGLFTYELFNSNADYNDPDVNFIMVNPDMGQRSSAMQSGNKAYMNVADALSGGNTATHEVLHLFGLSDRYNYHQKVEKNPLLLSRGSSIISNDYNLIPLALKPEEDAQYFGNEARNMMVNAAMNEITQAQWQYVFSSRTEPDYGGVTTFFTIPSHQISTPLRVIDGHAVYFIVNNKSETVMKKAQGIAGWYQSGGARRGPSDEKGTKIFNKSNDAGETNYKAP